MFKLRSVVLGVGISCVVLACAALPMRLNGQTPDTDKIKTFGLGVGLGVRWNILHPDLVDEATLDANGIVRVNSRVNTAAGFWLEGHAYYPFKNNSLGLGPFVAVQFGSDQIITAGGAGLMFGIKSTSLGNGNSLGLGIGYAALPKAKVLGNEFVADQPAPKGPDGTVLPLRYQERDKGSLIFIVSFSFLGKRVQSGPSK